ncbi:AraC family transcriptional regulator [Microlunatus speluncae]|uniref:AraC family transcriptional regulator n=1 Tax=Microlunatus speluncae TaxID=2594267 RepID=UPI0013757801|nr:AraC family transcriptional regulator [Microlunatus speluncae]
MHRTPSPEITMLTVGAHSARAGQHAAPHRHAGWKVAYHRSGRIDSIVDGRRHDVSPGTVLVLRPGAAHAEIAHTAYANYYLVLRAPPDHPWPERCDGPAARDLGTFLSVLLREDGLGARRDPRLISAMITAIDLTLQRHHPSERPDRAEEIVRAVEQFFEEHFAGPISIAGSAAEVGVSTSSLRQFFGLHRGMTPQAALRAVRVRHALGLLRRSDLTQAAIADRCGFASASHLSRVIAAETGSRPGALRGPP